MQGCRLRKIRRSPKVPYHEIRHVFDVRMHEGALNDGINCVQKACAIQM